MLSVVKMPLKGEVGILIEITLLIMENHGKIMELCFCISVGILQISDEPLLFACIKCEKNMNVQTKI